MSEAVDLIRDRFKPNDYDALSHSKVEQRSPGAFSNRARVSGDVAQGWSGRLAAHDRFAIPNDLLRSFSDRTEGVSTHSTTKPAITIGFVIKQEWEGCVEFVDGIIVVARIIDVASRDTAITVARIPLKNFKVGDRHRLVPGTIFRWAIGTEVRGKTHKTVSYLAIRVLPVWSRRELEAARAEGDELFNELSSVDYEPVAPKE